MFATMGNHSCTIISHPFYLVGSARLLRAYKKRRTLCLTAFEIDTKEFKNISSLLYEDHSFRRLHLFINGILMMLLHFIILYFVVNLYLYRTRFSSTVIMKGDSEELLDIFSPLFPLLSKSYDFMKFKETKLSPIYYNKLHFLKS